MRKTGILPAALICVLGGVGTALRSWELATAFESETGLAISGAPATTALVGLSLATAIICLLLALRLKARTALRFHAVFGSSGLRTALPLLLPSLLILFCGVLEIGEARQYGQPLLMDMIWLFLAIAAGLSLLTVTLSARREQPDNGLSLLSIIPVLFLCAWLIFAYMDRATDPVILDYAYEFFALGFSVLGFYYTSGFAFEKPRPRRMAFCTLMAVYFSLVTLADGHTLCHKGIFLGLAAQLLIYFTQLMGNRGGDAAPSPQEASSEKNGPEKM